MLYVEIAQGQQGDDARDGEVAADEHQPVGVDVLPVRGIPAHELERGQRQRQRDRLGQAEGGQRDDPGAAEPAEPAPREAEQGDRTQHAPLDEQRQFAQPHPQGVQITRLGQRQQDRQQLGEQDENENDRVAAEVGEEVAGRRAHAVGFAVRQRGLAVCRLRHRVFKLQVYTLPRPAFRGRFCPALVDGQGIAVHTVLLVFGLGSHGIGGDGVAAGAADEADVIVIGERTAAAEGTEAGGIGRIVGPEFFLLQRQIQQSLECLGPAATEHIIRVEGIGDGNQDRDHGNDDRQLDQGEARLSQRVHDSNL